jgi:hypothetical protein
VSGNHPGTLARLIAQHRGDLHRNRRGITLWQRGKIGGQAGQLTEGARDECGFTSLRVFLQAEPPLSAGCGKGLKGLLTLGVRSTKWAAPLLSCSLSRPKVSLPGLSLGGLSANCSLAHYCR